MGKQKATPIRVVVHLDCGHRVSGSIQPNEVNKVLSNTLFTCDRCSYFGAGAIQRAVNMLTIEEVRPLRVA